MTKTMLAAAAAAACFALTAGAASAQEQDFQPKAQGTWMVNLRVSDVAPAGQYGINTAAGAATGLKAKVGDDIMPTLGVTYFMTDKLAVEVIAGTTKHTISAVGAAGSTAVSDQWVLPPTLDLQYHPLPQARISPYVGAGVNYMLFYSAHGRNGFTVDVNNGFGWVLQAGTDIAVQGPWSLNLDAKKIFFSTDADINAGALNSRVKLNPWVLSAGFGRKF